MRTFFLISVQKFVGGEHLFSFNKTKMYNQIRPKFQKYLHESGDDYFVATLVTMSKNGEAPLAYAAWTNTVTTLLPAAVDLVSLVDVDAGNIRTVSIDQVKEYFHPVLFEGLKYLKTPANHANVFAAIST